MPEYSYPKTVDLLQQAESGDASAVQQVFAHIYEDLRRVAGGMLRQQPGHHTLQATSVVHDAYLRLIRKRGVGWTSRAHFIDVAAKVMRHILVDHARRRSASKRGGGWNRITLSDTVQLIPQTDVDVLALEQVLEQLADLDARKSKVVELRFYGGLTIDETAKVLNISPKTVEADWYFARAWLRAALSEA